VVTVMRPSPPLGLNSRGVADRVAAHLFEGDGPTLVVLERHPPTAAQTMASVKAAVLTEPYLSTRHGVTKSEPAAAG
jgi:hypothetical protein